MLMGVVATTTSKFSRDSNTWQNNCGDGTLGHYSCVNKQVKLWTQCNPYSSKYYNLFWKAGPEHVALVLEPFFHFHSKLSVEDNCIMWEHWVILPPQGKQQLLDELHVAHPGTERMKSLACSYLWWPGVDADIQQKVKQCKCVKSTKENYQWYHYIHGSGGEHLGTKCISTMLDRSKVKCFGFMDSYLKRLDIHVTSSIFSAITIDKLQATFVALGLPEMVVSNNWTCFSSQKFQTFCEVKWNITFKNFSLSPLIKWPCQMLQYSSATRLKLACQVNKCCSWVCLGYLQIWLWSLCISYVEC